VPGDVARARILPEHYVEAAGEAIPQAKITAQQRLTVQQLMTTATVYKNHNEFAGLGA